MLLRKLLRAFFAILFRLFSKVEVFGLEKIPAKGGGILAPNHVGFMDAPLLFVLVRREDFTALVAKKHQKNLILRTIVNIAGGIWLNRDDADTHAIRAAKNHLQNGGLLGLAPEGTRSRSGTLLQAKTGVAFLAEKAGVPIYPVAISGTYRGFHKLLKFQKPSIVIFFGDPFTPIPVEKGRREEILMQNTEEIMIRLAAMLPPEYRGYYADHPRLLKMLAEKESGNRGTAPGNLEMASEKPRAGSAS
jgi:1-acyl-sn-glycerol-3-phosphate acyltransferase